MKLLLWIWAEQGLLASSIYQSYTYIPEVVRRKEKKMKLAHQELHYILFNGLRYYWQPSQGYSLDKSSCCLRHEVLDYDRACVML